MVAVAVHATFWTDDWQSVESIMRSWLAADDLEMKSRHGLEMNYRTDSMEFTAFEGVSSQPSNYFQLEGHIGDAVEAAVDKLRNLRETCRSAGVDFSGEYEELDEDGNPLSDEKPIT